MQGLKRALMRRMPGAELTGYLGYEAGETPPPVRPNRRNGTGRKRVEGAAGAFEIDVPRDLDGSFEPRLIGKGRTRIGGLDDRSESRGRSPAIGAIGPGDDGDGPRPVADAVRLALGITSAGTREVLGLWIAGSGRGREPLRGIVAPDHGARFRLGVTNELRNRGGGTSRSPSWTG